MSVLWVRASGVPFIQATMQWSDSHWSVSWLFYCRDGHWSLMAGIIMALVVESLLAKGHFIHCWNRHPDWPISVTRAPVIQPMVQHRSAIASTRAIVVWPFSLSTL